MAALFAWLVSGAARGFAGIPGRIVATAPLLCIGKIGCGIHVYHPVAVSMLGWAAKRAGLGHFDHGWTGLPLATPATLVVASLSWLPIERPINDVKRYFAD